MIFTIGKEKIIFISFDYNWNNLLPFQFVSPKIYDYIRNIWYILSRQSFYSLISKKRELKEF